jgi:hypothetical protein
MLGMLRLLQRAPRKMGQGPVRNRLPLTQRSPSGQTLSFVAAASAELVFQTMGWKLRADGRHEQQDDRELGRNVGKEIMAGPGSHFLSHDNRADP